MNTFGQYTIIHRYIVLVLATDGQYFVVYALLGGMEGIFVGKLRNKDANAEKFDLKH